MSAHSNAYLLQGGLMAISRTRTRDERRTEMRTYTYTSPPLPSVTEVSARGISGSIATIMDNNHKNFRSRSARGEVIISDCIASREVTEFTPGHLTRYVKSSGWTGVQDGDFRTWLVGAPALPPDNSQLVDGNALLIKAYANMNGSAIMSGEILREMGSTIDMLKSPFGRSRDLVRKILAASTTRRARLRSAGNAAKALSNAWLEYRYGWKPILLDAEKIIKEVHKIRERTERRRLVARAGSQSAYNADVSWTATASIQRAGSLSVSIKRRVDVGIVYEIINRTPTQVVADTFGTRARDLPANVWEAVPYSFVVDWFVNVGDWIQAITPNPNINVRGSWLTESSRTVRSISGRIDYVDPPQTDNWHGELGGEVVTTTRTSRQANPEMTFRPALTQLSLSMLHQADAMALLVRPILGELKKLRH